MKLDQLKKLAIEAAKQSDLRVRVGAACDMGFSGWNKKRTHPALKRWGYPENSHVHAELDLAIRMLAIGLRGRTVCIVRLLRDDSLALAKPCQHCMILLHECGAKKVIWSTGIGWGELCF